MKKLTVLVLTIVLAGCSSGFGQDGAKVASPKLSKNEPFMPLGWYTSLEENELAGLKSLGGNLAITYVLSGRLKKEQLSDYLDEADRKGIKVLMDITADWKWFDDDMPVPSEPLGNWMWTLEYAHSKRASHHGGWDDEKNEHGFVLKEDGYPVMNVQEYDVIEQWVYIPKNAEIKELLIELYAAKKVGPFSWAHRVYWGEDLVPKQVDGKNIPAFRAGDIPKERDKWVKLTFKANDIDLQATVVKGVNFVNFGSQVYWDLMTRRTGKERIFERVQYLKDKPALYGWYLCDEPELRNIDPARLKELHDQVREADPNPEHVIAPVFQDWKVIEQYSASCDQIFLDCYPILQKSRVMDWMNKWLSEGSRIARKQGKPFIFVPQGFGDAPEYPMWTVPTEFELRWMTWMPIIMGARGICYWAYYKSTPKLLDASKRLFEEIKEYQSFLLSGTPVTGVSCSIMSDSDSDGNPDVLYAVFDNRGKRLLVAANATGRNFRNVEFVGAGYSFETSMTPYQVVIKESEF